MSRFASGWSGQFDLQKGCRSEMELGVDRGTEAILREKRLPVPPPVKLQGLIDTGATATGIDSAYIEQLSLKSKGYEHCLSAGGLRYAPVCIVRIRLLLNDVPWEVDYHPCACFDNLASGGEGALIGLDIRSNFHFHLEGPSSRFRLLLPEVGTEPPPPPLVEGSAWFDPSRECFLRHVSGEWREYHPAPIPKSSLLEKLKKRFRPHR